MTFDEWLSMIADKMADYESKLAVYGKFEIDVDKVDFHNPVESFEQQMEEQRPGYKALKNDIHSTYAETFRVYLNSSKPIRKDIEKLFQGRRDLHAFLMGYPVHVSKSIHDASDTTWLELGLVAAVIGDGGSEFRDAYRSLSTLYEKARDCGIDPLPYFAKVDALYPSAGISILADFLKSAQFRSIL